jgi:hypothetical protein
VKLVHYKFRACFPPGVKPVWNCFKRYESGEGMSEHAPSFAPLGDNYWGWAWDSIAGGDVFGDVLDGDGVAIELESTREAAIVLGQEIGETHPQMTRMNADKTDK